MANYININFVDELDTIALKLNARNNSDSHLYFDILYDGSSFDVHPDEEIRVLVAPSSASLSSADASGMLLRDNRKDDSGQGYYYTSFINSTDSTQSISFDPIQISTNNWENTKFDLHWLRKFGSYSEHGSNVTGVYSLPHNIQPDEIYVSGVLSNNNQINYNVKWNSITNESGCAYYLQAKYLDGTFANDFTDYKSYASGTMSSGINFDLPFNNEYADAPAIYNFQFYNSGVGGVSDIVSVKLNHQELLTTDYLRTLDNETFTAPNPDNIQLYDNILIDAGTIDRKRMSIGINDIAVSSNSYVKEGTYVSKPYILDIVPYSFALRIKEFIPDYGANVNPYDVIKYYVEFNSKEWLRISPINRSDEFSNNKLIPKLIIFDVGENSDPNVFYTNFESNIHIFRVKIVFDVSFLNIFQFAPPEVYDYKSIVYSKNQLLSTK